MLYDFIFARMKRNHVFYNQGRFKNRYVVVGLVGGMSSLGIRMPKNSCRYLFRYSKIELRTRPTFVAICCVRPY